MLDEINDAVMHLLRNAVDHEIEKPEDRKKAGKKDTGKVILSAWRERNFVVISVEDDGAGLDIEKIKKIAVERKIITGTLNSSITDRTVFPCFTHPHHIAEVLSRQSQQCVDTYTWYPSQYPLFL